MGVGVVFANTQPSSNLSKQKGFEKFGLDVSMKTEKSSYKKIIRVKLVNFC